MNDKSMREDTKDLVGKAMRSDKRLKAEDLVANELATAVLSEPMRKIRHTSEALMLLGEDEKQAAGISEDEEEEAEKIYDVCTALQNAHIDKFEDEYGQTIERSATISWSFDRNEVEEYLSFLETVSWKAYGRNNKRMEKAEELAEEDKPLQSFYVATSSEVVVPTLKRVKNQFVSYAMPKTGKLLKKIIQVVSSSSFQAAIDRLKGGASSG